MVLLQTFGYSYAFFSIKFFNTYTSWFVRSIIIVQWISVPWFSLTCQKIWKLVFLSGTVILTIRTVGEGMLHFYIDVFSMMNVKLNNITLEYVTKASVSFHIKLYIDLVHNDELFVSMHMHMCMHWHIPTWVSILAGWIVKFTQNWEWYRCLNFFIAL